MKLNAGRIVVWIIVIALAASAVAGGVILMDKDSSSGDRTVVDSFGRDVRVPENIDSIFCEDCCTLQIVSWFKAVDKVTAIDSRDKIVPSKTYTQVFKDKLETLEKVDASNAEEIIKLNPTIVLCSTPDVQKISDKQSQYGVPVFYINADIEFENELWYTQITKLGQLFHEESRAKEIVDGVKKIRSDLSAFDFSSKKAYVCGMMYYGTGDYLKTTGDYIPFEWIRLSNVMPSKGVDGQPYNTTRESLAAAVFDYVFIDGSNCKEVKKQLIDFKSKVRSDEPAFVNGDVYVTLTYKIWGTQWDNVLMNCFYVKNVLTGGTSSELIEDINCMLRLFYGDRATYDQLKSWNPDSFEKAIL